MMVASVEFNGRNHGPLQRDPRLCASRSWDLEQNLWHFCNLLQHEHDRKTPTWDLPHKCDCGLEFRPNRNDEMAKQARNHTNPRDKP